MAKRVIELMLDAKQVQGRLETYVTQEVKQESKQ
jgi:hypothetical protein